MDIAFLLVLAATSTMTFFAVLLAVSRLGAAWDVLASTRMRSLTSQAEAVSMEMSELWWWLRVWGICLIGVPLFFWLVLDLLTIGLGLAYFVYVAPQIILDHLIVRRRRRLRDQLVTATQCLANTSQAGLNLHDGLQEVLKESEAPLSQELERIVNGYRFGQSMHEALDVARRRLKLEPFTLFASAMQITLDRGGPGERGSGPHLQKPQ